MQMPSARSARVAVAVLGFSALGVGLLKQDEGFKNRAYLDSIGKPTICVGHTGPEVKLGLNYSDEECVRIMLQDVNSAESAVRRSIKVPLYQHEFDALVSFCFNVGNTACTTSTMFKLINNGDYNAASLQFVRWRYAGGLDCAVRSNNCYGVYLRRISEAKLWKGEY